MEITRASFLKVMAAGAVAAGIAVTPRAATAATARRIPPVTDIDKLYDAWQERFNTGDLEGLVDLYVDDVTYVNPDGVTLIGKSKVHEDLKGLLSIKPQIVLGNRRHVLYNDVALTTNHWRMNFVSAEGAKQELTGGGIEVMRKQADGGWRYIIDDASRSASK
ncbi:MAG: SgcJ/EcaC family oxidoreductase [Sphingomonadales bacterium]